MFLKLALIMNFAVLIRFISGIQIKKIRFNYEKEVNLESEYKVKEKKCKRMFKKAISYSFAKAILSSVIDILIIIYFTLMFGQASNLSNKSTIILCISLEILWLFFISKQPFKSHERFKERLNKLNLAILEKSTEKNR